MEINGPPPSIIKPAQLPKAISNWQIGQTLQATVVRQASPQSLILQIANQQFEAESNIRLPAGQKLELQVSQLGDKITLQAHLLKPTQATAGTDKASRPIATDIAINTILKQALPKQASMATLLANLSWLNQSTAKNVPIPTAVVDIAKQLFNQLPVKDEISNKGQLKQNILNSGVFLEGKLNKLASQKLSQTLQQSPQAQPGVDKSSADLKLGLLRLLGAIQQITKTTPQTSPQTTFRPFNSQTLLFTPPTLRGTTPQAQPKAQANLAGLTNLPLQLLELGKQIEASLARTQLHQAASLPASEQSTTNLAFELPIRNNEQIDIFDIIINEEDDRQERDETDNKQQWGVSLAFDLEGLGPVHAKLRMVDNKISTTFWAETPETTRLFNENLENLRHRYRQAGLEGDDLCCYPGTPPKSTASKLPHIVLDINA